MNTSRRGFLGAAAALSMTGCATSGKVFGFGPNLRLGVISDIHITDWASTEIFRKTLRYFRERRVNAVLISGDLADHGILPQLKNVAKAWFEVFPDNRGLDGEAVEKLFIYGNHDLEGLCYCEGDERMRNNMRFEGFTFDEAKKHTLTAYGYGRAWEECFHEPYAPIYHKRVKGYDFIGGHWDPANGCNWWAGPRIDEWMEAHGSEIDTSKPFFYFQHPHPRGTVYAEDSWGDDAGATLRAFSHLPNAVVISGHSHRSLTDERTYWRGEFTSIGASTLSYVSLPGNFRTQVPDFSRNLCCRHGQLVDIYDDCMVIERRDFIHDEPLGEEVRLPMPTVVSSFPARAVARVNEPRFAVGTRVTVSKTGEGLVAEFPGAFARESALPFQYWIRWIFTLADGKERVEEMVVYQENIAFSKARARRSVNRVRLPKDRVPEAYTAVKVLIAPRNCYGVDSKECLEG